MKRWSIVPQNFSSATRMPRTTFVVPMTPEASAAQIAMLQNRHHMFSTWNHLENEIDTARDKASDAYRLAMHTQEQVDQSNKNLMHNQVVMFLLVAVFVVFFIYMMRNNYF